MLFDCAEFIDDLSDRLVSFTISDVPSETRARARNCLIDTIGVGLAGTQQPVCKIVLRWVRENCAAGQSRLLNSEERLCSAGVAFANTVACHALDFDDTCYDGIVHASAVALPTALAVVDRRDGSGTDLLEAYMAGCQATVEIGRIMTDDLYRRGWFTTSLLGQLGACVSAARATGCDRALLRRALSLCVCSVGGFRAVLGSEAKPYLAGMAAESGIRSVELTTAGMSAPADPWRHENGFLGTIGVGIHPKSHPRNGRWCFDEPGVALKLFPVCSAAQAAAEGLQDVIETHGLTAQRIRRIAVGGTDLVVKSLPYERPETPQQAQFSMKFALGCILSTGTLGPEHLSAEVIASPHLQAEMDKVTLRHDDDLESAIDRIELAPEAASLLVETEDGRLIRHVVPAASGMARRPFTQVQLMRKFVANAVCAGWSHNQAAALFELLTTIEEQPSLKSISLAPQNGPE